MFYEKIVMIIVGDWNKEREVEWCGTLVMSGGGTSTGAPAAHHPPPTARRPSYTQQRKYLYHSTFNTNGNCT